MSTNNPLDLSIVIPAYDEERRIGHTLGALDAYLAGAGVSYEILVVDDGSRDGTVALVRGLARHARRLRCLESTPNRGKGHAVRLGMLAARGQVRVMYDADGSVPPEELPRIVNPVRLAEVDIAIGSRYAAGARVARRQPWYRRWWSRLANRVVQRALVRGVEDTQCGFKAFSADAAEAVFARARVDGWAFDLEALALARRLRLSLREVAVSWRDDPRSRIHPLRDAWRVTRELLAIRRNLARGVYGRLPAPSLPLP
jgi:dolichyl-phosphate beta-glucosyltransferase